MKYRKHEKYPEVKVERKNTEYARLLMHAYAGSISEETAIHQYLFQNMVLPDEMNEERKILQGIAIVEMHHLKLLGELIKKLGVYPIYADCSSKSVDFWNAESVDYEVFYENMLIANIKAEKEAIKDYRLLMNVIDDCYIKEILSCIIDDEEVHVEIFTNLLNQLDS